MSLVFSYTLPPIPSPVFARLASGSFYAAIAPPAFYEVVQRKDDAFLMVPDLVLSSGSYLLSI
jgi:hypothetical protein